MGSKHAKYHFAVTIEGKAGFGFSFTSEANRRKKKGASRGGQAEPNGKGTHLQESLGHEVVH